MGQIGSVLVRPLWLLLDSPSPNRRCVRRDESTLRESVDRYFSFDNPDTRTSTEASLPSTNERTDHFFFGREPEQICDLWLDSLRSYPAFAADELIGLSPNLSITTGSRNPT